MKKDCIAPKKKIPIRIGDTPIVNVSQNKSFEIRKKRATNRLIKEIKNPNIVITLKGSFEC